MTNEERDVKTLLEWFEPNDLTGPVRGHKVWCDVVSRYERTGQLNIDCDCGFTEMPGIAARLTARLAAVENVVCELPDLLDHLIDAYTVGDIDPEGTLQTLKEMRDALANAAGDEEGGNAA